MHEEVITDIVLLEDYEFKLLQKNILMSRCREECAELIDKIFPGYVVHASVVPAGSSFFRARVVEDRKSQIKDFSYPPKVGLGRCNHESEVVFYASNMREVAVFETKVLGAGENIIIGEWVNDTPIICCPVGYSRSLFQSLGSSREVPGFDRGERNKGDIPAQYWERTEAINNFFGKMFMNSNEDSYFHSASVASNFMKRRIQFSLDDSEKAFEMPAIMYPTMQMSANGDNFAMPTSFVDKHMKLVSCEYLNVKDREGQIYEVSGIDFTRKFDAENVLWEGRAKGSWVINEDYGSLTFSVVDGEYVARDKYGNIVEPLK